MNKLQREEIKRLNDILDNARSGIDTLKDEQQEEFDELSEAKQQSTYGEELERIIGLLEQASESIDNAIADIVEAHDRG